MSEITRRACGLLFCDLLGTAACSQPNQDLATDLRGVANEQGLAIVSLWYSGMGNRTELSAFTVAGAEAGKIVLAERPKRVTVSPDGLWLAWDKVDRDSSRPFPRVFVTNGSQPTRSLNLPADFVGSFGISSKGEHLTAVVEVAGPKVHAPVQLRVIVLHVPTLKVEEDVSDVVAPLTAPGRASRLAVAGLCEHRLLAVCAGRFMVIDLPSHKPILSELGSSAALSPDGESVAFVDTHRNLVVTNFSTGVRRALLGPWWRVFGVGAWSPDGRYLLVGAVQGLSFSTGLIAVECATNRFADVMPLGDLAGNGFVWIRRNLLRHSAPR